MARERSAWMLMEKLNLQNEDVSVLLLCPDPEDTKKYVIVQAKPFQGALYPCHMGFNIDASDAITNAVAWRPVPYGTQRFYDGWRHHYNSEGKAPKLPAPEPSSQYKPWTCS